ncbi:hypothetical protein GW916_11550 [bacterium]|nr:hypothetical protein [bacterium]
MRFRNTPIQFCLMLVLCGGLFSCNGNESESRSDADFSKPSVKEVIEGGKATGVDMSGKERSCMPMGPGRMCTMEFTPADEFARVCQSEGHKAVQCGCHDWICIKK